VLVDKFGTAVFTGAAALVFAVNLAVQALAFVPVLSVFAALTQK
jgi:hypothetical protein